MKTRSISDLPGAAKTSAPGQITDEAEATRANRGEQAEARLRATVEEIGDIKAALDEHASVAITDPQGRITYANDKFCATSKYSREELLGQDHRILNSGYHPAEFWRELWATITNGKVWHGQIRNRIKDGSFRWFETTIVPFLDADGKPRQYIAIRTDITGGKLHAQERSLLAAVVKNSDDAIITIDLKGSVTSWNKGAERIYGYRAAEMFGKPIAILIPAEMQAGERTIYDAVGRGKLIEHYETQRLRKDGTAIDVSLTMSPVRDNSGRIVGASKIARDVTERKRAEDEIRRLNVRLEQRVAERTAELEASNKELEAFSYSVSHDLRAPLRAVDGFSKAVLEDYGPLLPDEGRHYLETIRQGAQKMGALTDDLLTLSRLSRLALSKRDVNTVRLVGESLQDLGFPMKDRHVEVKIAELPPALGDQVLLKQLWLNLLSNALKYTRLRESALIEVGFRRDEQTGETVYFVRDNGTGFDMRYGDKLFGVFQRLHREEDFEGTGVGLAIVQRIVHRHGGRVWAEAAVDQGATFYFTLEGETNHE